MKAISLAVVITLLTPIGGSAQGSPYAWWVTATFQARDEAVEGIPVRDLDREWVRASAISASDLPPEARQRGESPEEHGFSLALEADLDGDGRPERAVVGVFQARSGETGRFLLILGKSETGGEWVKRAVFSHEGAAGFSAIAVKDGRLQWVTCFECDTGCEVLRSGRRFRVRCYSCC